MNAIQSVSAANFMMNTKGINNKNGQDPFLTDAASVLGLSYDELLSELESGKDLDTIVTDQGLSVDEFREKMDELNPNKGQADSTRDAAPPPPPGKGTDQFLTDAASVLNLSSEELTDLLESGKDLQTIIEEQGLTMEDFQKQMYELFNSHQAANVDQVGNIVNETV
ncbi:hypothetical protein L9W92_09275 [Pelotomaculum terephthalicicum JT]|uniref:hypothetical protein n=1 Tax=Pelotomaculum TaxID=191373 RepID=UPI0009CE9A94|nr:MULTISPECIES: hypothetical protein [Pelotomaculum]MCG9968242.1 hypothetical protein [Pelotomaculum terephthalicicum JT]OPX91193.1 MAG: hypothetical protein A4E54_00430 [Pelotomaculum sp. PtaB.Bin117]OPY60831.1 MAG: hypothetical protein A4E56_02443 [Pelotomaculum sp. PtaU1.Bin065]